MEDMSKICDRFQQFCANSAKPLLYGGAILTLISSLAIGYLGCTSNAFFRALNEDLAASKFSNDYYIQLAASVYLLLIAVLVCATAHYEQKHAIRVVAILTTLNVLLVPAAYLFMETNQLTLPDQFSGELESLEKLYDFTDKPAIDPANVNGTQTNQQTDSLPQVLELNQTTAKAPNKRQASNQLTKENATKVWDFLQSRGCCGFNSSDEWKTDLPKSCCSNPKANGSKYTCEKADEEHKRACKDVIDMERYKSIGLLAFIGLINLYLAVISLIGAYRTLHYDEASQNAYN